MFEFESTLMVTSIESRTSKTGNNYILIKVLMDNGETTNIMYVGETLDYTKIVKMNSYNMHLRLVIGKYTALSITKIEY